MNEIKSTDPLKLAEHLRKGAKFDVGKAREAYFRAYDNQMIMEMYAVRAKEASKMKDQWDIYDPLGTVPARARTWRCSPRRRTEPARWRDVRSRHPGYAAGAIRDPAPVSRR